ncbi:MAG TPA: type II toxin-antitoxin system HicA family toxin [Stellaceae bacterium]|jgi:predicted RNA binding protein YcfA (HicA-like mRNA interferase family)|nr:type II toxin-antitoxin system HicA family toxin [Stellaceae bacterium]
MTSNELIRKLRRRTDIAFEPRRGKGGHIQVRRGERKSHIPTGSGELGTGLLLAILKQLGLTLDDLR